MRTQSLWGEKRSPSFIFLVYPNTVARVQRAPGQATTPSWSDEKCCVCPQRTDSRSDRKGPGRCTSLADSSWDRWEMWGLPLWGWEQLLRQSGCWGFNDLKFYISFLQGSETCKFPSDPRAWGETPGSRGKPSITYLESRSCCIHDKGESPGCQGLPRKLVDT